MVFLRVHRMGVDVGTIILRERGQAGFDLSLSCQADPTAAE